MEFEEIYNTYKKLGSLTKTAKYYNCSRTKITNILHKNNIITENRQNITKFNEHVFDIIDTEEKAYWLGFIFADGYIAKDSYKFELSLKNSDSSHLDKFNMFMSHINNNVKISKTSYKDFNGDKIITMRCRWFICNKHLWNTLNNYGCTPQKSLTLNFPDISIFSKPSLIRHFIRGYFDGDGCLSKARYNKPAVSILSTVDFLEKIIIYSPVNFPAISKTKSMVYSIKLSHKKALQFLYYIYSNSNIYLDRKYNLYCQYLEQSKYKEEIESVKF